MMDSILKRIARIPYYAALQIDKIKKYRSRYRYSITEHGGSGGVDISIVVSATERGRWPSGITESFDIFGELTVEYIVAGRKIPQPWFEQLEHSGSPVTRIEFSRTVNSSVIRNRAASCATGRWLLFVSAAALPRKLSVQSLVRSAEASGVGVLGLPFEAADGQRWAGIRVGYRGAAGPLLPSTPPRNSRSNHHGLVATVPGFLFCSREVFWRAKKFDERLSGGFEEIALAWMVATKLHKTVSAVDRQGLASLSPGLVGALNAGDCNSARFYDVYRSFFQRECIRSGLVAAPGGSDEAFTIGLVITDDAEDTMAGDAFTAQDLALFFRQEHGWKTHFLPRLSKKTDWYDVAGLDCVLVLLDNYDIRKLKNARPGLIKVAWLRNWFERWVGHRWFKSYDLALCSSERARNYVAEHCALKPEVLRIASNHQRFHPGVSAQGALASDYCFTGSYWGSPRDIEKFKPAACAYDFAVYGGGWQQHKNFSGYWRGELPYAQLPAVYASTKLLVDDANHVTKPWASVNSRVFDALAAGVLVITNGDKGAEETFTGKLPSYDGVEDLEAKVDYYLSHAVEREALAQQLHREVLEHHTYRHRAIEFKHLLHKRLVKEIRVAIKVAVPHRGEAKEWGDFHFGNALAAALEKLGYRVRVDILPEWYCGPAQEDDVAIVIRGLSAYKPVPSQLNLLWQISHPDKIDDGEYQQYDHIYVASAPYAKLLQQRLAMPVTPLLQCTDPSLFYCDSGVTRRGDVLFVGNSRLQLRPVVRHAIEAKLPLSVYGAKWDGLIDSALIAGTHIENSALRRYYAECGVLLNDHWDSMKQYGFISNRLFDAAACGAIVVSDRVDGVAELFHGLVYQYEHGHEELATLVRQALHEGDSRIHQRRRLAREIAEGHSFDARALVLSETIVRIFEHTDCRGDGL